MDISDIEQVCEEGEVFQANVEYRSNTKAVTPVNRLFLVQYINGRKTEYRKCIKCSDIIKFPNFGTSALNKHSEICGKKTRGKKPADQRRFHLQTCATLMKSQKPAE